MGLTILLANFSILRKKVELHLHLFNTKLYPFQNISLGFILKIFLKFRKFQPRYSNKIYSCRKKEIHLYSSKIRITAVKPKYSSC